MGRKPNTQTINVNHLETAMKRAKLSYRKLGNDESFGINERTIRRAKDSGYVSSMVLDKLAKRLNVSPAYLSFDQSVLDNLKETDPKVYEHICDIDKHPYNEFDLKRNQIDQKKHLAESLMLSDIPYEQFLSLSEEEQLSYQIQKDLLLEMFNIYFFRKQYNGHPHYLTQERLQMAVKLFEGTEYSELLKML